MRFDVLTLFPGIFRGPLDETILRRAQDAGLVEVQLHDLRDWAIDPHRTVDDYPFGGGPGMVMKPEPIFAAVEAIQPLAEPDEPRERVDHLEAVATGPSDQCPAVVGSEIDRRVHMAMTAARRPLVLGLALIARRFWSPKVHGDPPPMPPLRRRSDRGLL